MAEQEVVVVDECWDVRLVWEKNYHEGVAGNELLGDFLGCDHCAIVQSDCLAF